MTATITSYRSAVAPGSDGFGHLLRAEWTKFRSVRAWVIGTAFAAVVMILFGILAAAGSHSSYATPQHPEGITGHPHVPIGPNGQAVTDRFTFVHQPLAGDGTITVRVASLTGASAPAGPAGAPDNGPPAVAAVQPWSKAGLMIKENTKQGSAYAAIMITGQHGVRMQDNYTGDIAGPTGTGARWLRLTRTGGTVTGYASTDGTTWTTVGTVHVSGLSGAVQAGLFVTSPDVERVDQHLGGGSVTGGPSFVAATFDSLSLPGDLSADAWTGTQVGSGANSPQPGLFQQTGDVITAAGSGDIAPDLGEGGETVAHVLTGVFAALIVVAVLGALFITTEYRRGLIRTSLTASPRRGRVLAAKAVVIGAITFVTALIGIVITIPIAEHLLRGNGNFVYPISVLTSSRVVVGSAGLIAVAAVIALALGTILRRSVAAVAAAIVVLVLPYLLATSGALPDAAAQWLLRVTPAAGFAIQQTIPAYPQVDHAYTATAGFFPLAPWAGFAVLCAWAALALGIAAHLLRRRDA